MEVAPGCFAVGLLSKCLLTFNLSVITIIPFSLFWMQVKIVSCVCLRGCSVHVSILLLFRTATALRRLLLLLGLWSILLFGRLGPFCTCEESRKSPEKFDTSWNSLSKSLPGCAYTPLSDQFFQVPCYANCCCCCLPVIPLLRLELLLFRALPVLVRLCVETDVVLLASDTTPVAVFAALLFAAPDAFRTAEISCCYMYLCIFCVLRPRLCNCAVSSASQPGVDERMLPLLLLSLLLVVSVLLLYRCCS